MTMIEKKTAQLYYVAGKGGALIGRGTRKQVENMARYGVLFGIMFQIKDDLLNILMDQTTLGKQRVGSDILNGKRTLMVIHALSQVNDTNRKKMIAILGNEKATHKEVMDVIDIFRETGSIAYAEDKLKQFRDQAVLCLNVLKGSESKDILKALVEYSITRTY
jgi:geranylgeranyl diphosphate synthase type I